MKKEDVFINRRSLEPVRCPDGIISGHACLPALKDPADVVDVNEVVSVVIYCKDLEEAERVVALFPKYCRMRTNRLYGVQGRTMAVSAVFDAFRSTKVTGEVNEAAVKARAKVLEVVEKNLE